MDCGRRTIPAQKLALFSSGTAPVKVAYRLAGRLALPVAKDLKQQRQRPIHPCRGICFLD
jgi:hypothetical protein